MAHLLEVSGLQTVFDTNQGVARAVDGISFHIDAGDVVALVGESGCGKSVTALSIMRLVASPPGRIAAGTVTLEGRDLLALDEADMAAVRGNDLAMIFQEPMTSLNPVLTVGFQVAEALRLHRGLSKREAHEEVGADARTGRDSRRPPARCRLPARVERRHAAACDDRDGAIL